MVSEESMIWDELAQDGTNVSFLECCCNLQTSIQVWNILSRRTRIMLSRKTLAFVLEKVCQLCNVLQKLQVKVVKLKLFCNQLRTLHLYLSLNLVTFHCCIFSLR